MATLAATQEIAQAVRSPELLKRVYFTLGAIAIYVLVNYIPTPGVDPTAIQQFIQSAGAGNLLGIFNLFVGGGLARLSVLALGIMPYINASIMLQVLSAVYPELREMQQEGDLGRRQYARITRLLTVFLAALQAGGLMIALLQTVEPTVERTGGFWLGMVVAFLSLVAGAMFMMWLGEEITKHGIGNGVSLLIFIGIIQNLPVQLSGEFQAVAADPRRALPLGILFFSLFAITVGAVFITLAVRKVPVHYPRKQVAGRLVGGQASFLPIKMAQAGVIPIIFAIAVRMFPSTLTLIPSLRPTENELMLSFMTFWNNFWFEVISTFLLVVFFTFIYTAIIFNTQEIAKNLQRQGGFIPGIQPGRKTFEYLDKILFRVTFFGSIALGLITILPSVLREATGIQTLFISGIGLLIIVGVAIDTLQQLAAHMVMRRYTGFRRTATRVRYR